jgi:hypothetical protein
VIKKTTFSKPIYLSDGLYHMFKRTVIVANLSVDDILYDIASDEDFLGLDHADKHQNSGRNGWRVANPEIRIK